MGRANISLFVGQGSHVCHAVPQDAKMCHLAQPGSIHGKALSSSRKLATFLEPAVRIQRALGPGFQRLCLGGGPGLQPIFGTAVFV